MFRSEFFLVEDWLGEGDCVGVETFLCGVSWSEVIQCRDMANGKQVRRFEFFLAVYQFVHILDKGHE
jgi:hypothetical protein